MLFPIFLRLIPFPSSTFFLALSIPPSGVLTLPPGSFANGPPPQENKNKEVSTIITDLNNEIIVSYNGILPNLFAEGKGVVASGKLKDKKYFVADKIMANHDENYMPPEVKEALDKSN